MGAAPRGAGISLPHLKSSQRKIGGADWVDIGGVPFAPGPDVTVREELDRVIPVIEEAARGHPGW